MLHRRNLISSLQPPIKVSITINVGILQMSHLRHREVTQQGVAWPETERELI